MIDYRAGNWGFHVAFGLKGSLAPRSLAMALPNALITFLLATFWIKKEEYEEVKDAAEGVIAAFTAVMLFILYNRSRTSYSRWWEGGTLLQKTRGEWFNAYSSIMAFTSTKPEHAEQVKAYVHLIARLMSLLMCCGLQQVSPNRDRPFEIIDLEGIEAESMEFLNSAPDKVEIILQWIQRSMVIHMQTGVLPVAPPVLSRAFQEISRGIVNLQNARKIADFPYPFPLAQISMILQLLHWGVTPFAASLALTRGWAVLFSFFTIFVLWCIHFNALDLEFPFGSRVNDLPMIEFQLDWNKSVRTLMHDLAKRPPGFIYDPDVHDDAQMVMSDASELLVPSYASVSQKRRTVAVIKVREKRSWKTRFHKGENKIDKSGDNAAASRESKAAPKPNSNDSAAHRMTSTNDHAPGILASDPFAKGIGSPLRSTSPADPDDSGNRGLPSNAQNNAASSDSSGLTSNSYMSDGQRLDAGGTLDRGGAATKIGVSTKETSRPVGNSFASDGAHNAIQDSGNSVHPRTTAKANDEELMV